MKDCSNLADGIEGYAVFYFGIMGTVGVVSLPLADLGRSLTFRSSCTAYLLGVCLSHTNSH